MFDVNEGILGAADEDDGAGDLLDQLHRLEFSNVKISTFFFPHHLFNVLLNGGDNPINQETRQKREVVVAEFVDQHFEVCIGIVGDDGLDSSILGGVKDGSGCSHTASPEDDVGDSVLSPDVIDHCIYVFSFVVAQADVLAF